MADSTNILDLFLEYVEQVKAAPVDFCIAGVGLGLARFPVGIVMVVLVYGGRALGTIPGLVVESENLTLLGMVTVPLVLVVGMSLALALVFGPMEASIMRSLDAHFAGEEAPPLGIGSSFSTATQEPLRVAGYILASTLIYTLLTPFLLIPAVLFLIVTDLAWPIAVLERCSPLESMRIAFTHFRSDPGFHLGYWLILAGMTMILVYVPFVGGFILPGLVGGWRVFVFRAVRQDLDRG